jgi:hypothetical protein
VAIRAARVRWLPGIEVDVGKAVRRGAEDDADVLRLAVEKFGQIGLTDYALLPARIGWDF